MRKFSYNKESYYLQISFFLTMRNDAIIKEMYIFLSVNVK